MGGVEVSWKSPKGEGKDGRKRGRTGHPLSDVSRPFLFGVGGGEDDVDCFEGSSLGLGVEEVDDGDEERVGDGEDEEGGPADRGGHSGSDLDDEEVEQPVGHSAG
jgi:hypothetical protein